MVGVRFNPEGTVLHIVDSAFVSKRDFGSILTEAKTKYSNAPLWKERGIPLMKLEWATHNALYALGLWKERTKDVDLQIPQPFYEKAAYAISGVLVWLFIK